MEKMKKICKVCGDNAIGFNFNCLSCESCKSFFRRNALQFEKFKCRKDGTCVIDFITRKCCTRCRLAKCFSLGMKKELIWSHPHGRNISSSKKREKPLSSVNSVVKKRKRTNENEQHTSENCENCQEKANLNMKEIPQKFSAQNSPFENKYEFVPVSPLIEQIEILTAKEIEQIHEIHCANEKASFFDERRYKVIGQITNLICALNMAELYLKKTIVFCKSIAAFRTLDQDEQLLLLKDFFTEMMLVRMCFVLNREKDAIPIIKDEIKKTAAYVKIDLFYEAQKREVIEFCRAESHRFNAEMEGDLIIQNLILAQRLFKPSEYSSCPQFIKCQHDLYKHLLYRYLENKYSDKHKASTKVNQLYSLISSDLKLARDMLESMYSHVGADKLVDVLKEVYDLK